MNAFTWKDRESAAQHLLQLVFHGPDAVRRSAFLALSAIRSPSVIADLKRIALDSAWSIEDRQGAVFALSDMPNVEYLPEFREILVGYFGTGFDALQRAIEDSPESKDEIQREQLKSARDFVWAIFRLVGLHPSNHSWFFDLLDQVSVAVKAEFLTIAISSNCGYPWESELVGKLTSYIDQFPELRTLENFNTVANHGSTTEDQWLVAHAELFISLCDGADEMRVSSVLDYSPDLTRKVMETHVEIAKLSSLYPYLESLATSPSSDSTETASITGEVQIPAFHSSAIWQRLEQLYQEALNGDDTAFDQLIGLTDDYRLSVVPAKAVATYLLGKLWARKRALSKLCRLACDGDDTWGEYGQYTPVRTQAVIALHTTGTPDAWEALLNTIFLQKNNFSKNDEMIPRLLSALTSQLDPSIPFEPTADDRFYSNNEIHPWFHALTDLTDDIDAIRQDL